MRVVLVTNVFPPARHVGGAEVVNYHTCRGLIERGVDCSILVLNNRVSEAADTWYEWRGIPVHKIGVVSWRNALIDIFDPQIYRAARRALTQLEPDLVHFQNMSGATLAPYLVCRALSIPAINTLHDLWLLSPNNMLYRSDGSFCDPKLYPHGCRDSFRRYDFWANVPYRREVFSALTSNVQVFISPSQAVINRHVEAGYAPERFRLLPHGFSATPPQKVRDVKLFKYLQTAHRYRTIAFAGGGIEIKGPEVVLKALPSLLERFSNLRIAVAGGGDAHYLEQFAEYKPVVQLMGRLLPEDMRALFAASDLVIVPSVCHEASSVVAFESYQGGTPVVGSDFGGVPELIRPGETGDLFPVGNSKALSQRIIQFFETPPRERRRMRHNCVEFVRSELSLERHLDGLQAIYAEVLKG